MMAGGPALFVVTWAVAKSLKPADELRGFSDGYLHDLLMLLSAFDGKTNEFLWRWDCAFTYLACFPWKWSQS